jgi:hypothetical protein
MTYSYTQIANYLACPRRYRHRYIDGWQEKETRAAMLLGRVFEQALGAYFRREDAAAVFFREWLPLRDSGLAYANGDTWDVMAQQAIQLLNRFAQDDRVRIRQPRKNLQVKITRRLSRGNVFVAYIDAVGEMDGIRSLIEWKTTHTRYPEEPAGLLALDPQLICYSLMTGIAAVGMVVFVRKRSPEIQYLRTTVSDQQRGEYAELIAHTIQQIESAQFLPHSGIRFPNNGCVSCPYLGLCLKNEALIDRRLTRRPGAADLGWIDELAY